MKFSIRELLLVTAIVALGLGWWMEWRRFDSKMKEATDTAAKEAAGYKALSETLAAELKDKNPTAEIEIHVNGREATISRKYAPGP